MNALIIVGSIVVLLFGMVVAFGAPFLPTQQKQINIALDLLNLKPGQMLLELGCGDGRVLKAAAERDWYAVGYELNPILVLTARVRTWRYRKKVVVIWGNYWLTKWPDAEGIYTFLLQKYMKKLDRKIIQEYKRKHVKLVSYAFTIPKKKIVKEKQGMYLYEY